MEKVETWLKELEIIGQLSRTNHWRDRTDVFNGFSLSLKEHYCIKVIDDSDGEPSDSAIYTDEYKDTKEEEKEKSNDILIYDYLVLENKIKAVVFYKIGESLTRFMHVNEDVLAPGQAAALALKLIDLQKFLKSKGWRIADQIPNSLLFQGKNSLDILPLTVSDSNFKQHVYQKYANALAGGEIFPYPPETLYSALAIQDGGSIERGDNADVWAIGVILFIFLGGSKQTLLKLVDYTKRAEGILDLEGIPLRMLFRKIFETSPVRRISIDSLRDELLVLKQFTGKAIKPEDINSIDKESARIAEKYNIFVESDSIESLYNRGVIYLQNRDLKMDKKKGGSCMKKCLEKINAIEEKKQTDEVKIKRKQILRKLGKIELLRWEKSRLQNKKKLNEKEEKVVPSQVGQEKVAKQKKKNKISSQEEDIEDVDENNSKFNFEISLIDSDRGKVFSQNWKILWYNYINPMMVMKLTRTAKSTLYLAIKECFNKIISEIADCQTLQEKNTEISTDPTNNIYKNLELARVYTRALIDPQEKTVGMFLEQASVAAKDFGKNELLSKQLMEARNSIMYSLVDADAYELARDYAKEINEERLFNEYFIYHIGEVEYNQKNYEDAKIMMGRVLEGNPSNIKANMLMAKCAWNLKEYQILSKYLNKCLQIDPEMQEAKKLQKEWILKGEDKLKDNGDEKILDNCYKNVFSQYMPTCQILEILIERIPGIEKQYEQLKNSLEGESLDNKVQALTAFYGQHMEEIINNSFLVKTGQDKLLSESPEESLSYFQAALMKWPHSAHLKHHISNCLLKNKFRISMAKDLLKQAVGMVPQEFYTFYYQKAKYYIEKNQIDKALEHLDNLLKYAPNHAMGLTEYGKILVFHKKDYQSALRILKKSLSICDITPGIYSALGVAYYKLGKLDYAVPCLKLSKDLEKQDDYIEFIYGKAAYYKNQLIEAITVLQKILERLGLKHKHPTINFYIGICKKSIKQKSINYFEICALTSPNQTMQVTAIKIALEFYLNQNENEDLIIFLEKIKIITDKSNDPDLNAFMVKAILKCQSHYLLTMRYVEQGLQAKLFMEDDEYDFAKDIDLSSHLQFGCQIQKLKILFLMDRNPDKVVEHLKRLMQEMGKYQRIIQEQKLINQNNSKIEDKEIIKSCKIDFKKQKKQSWFVFDWIYEAELLLAEIYISQERYPEAIGILKNLLRKEISEEILHSTAHCNAVILLKQGQQEAGLKVLTKNLKHDRSIFLFGRILFEQRNFDSGRVKLNAVLSNNETNIHYFKIVGDLEFQRKNYIESFVQYKIYFDLVNSQNAILEKLDENRPGLPQRRIKLDCESIANLGFCYQYNNQLKLALKMFQLSLSINSKCLNAWGWFINQKIQLKDYVKAEIAVHNYLQIQKTAEMHYKLGLCRLHQNDRTSAMEQFQQAEKLDSKYFQALLSLGQIYFEDKQFELSEKYFRKCRELDDKDEEALIGLGKCLRIYTQNLKEAEECFSLSLKLNKTEKSFTTIIEFCKETHRLPDITLVDEFFYLYDENLEIIFYVGETYYQAAQATDFSKYNKIAKKNLLQLTTLLESESRFIMNKQISFLRLAQIAYTKKEFNDAQEYLKRYLGKKEMFYINEFAFEANILQAKLLIQRNTPNQSRIPKILLKCMKMKPSNELPYLYFVVYLMNKKSSAAWKFLEKAVNVQQKSNLDSCQQPKSQLLTFLKAMKVLELDDINLGIQLLESCAIEFDTIQITFFYLGKIYLKLEKYNKAIDNFNKCYESFVSSGPLINEALAFSVQNNIDCMCLLGLAYSKIHYNSEALKWIQKCLDIDKNNSTALRIQSEIYLEQGNIIKAMQSAQNATQLDDPAAQSFYLIATLSLQMKRYFQAIQALEQCNRINPNFPQINLKLGMIYESLARPQFSLKYFQNHLAHNPDSALVLWKTSKLLAYYGKLEQASSHVERLEVILKERDRRIGRQENQIEKNKTRPDLKALTDIKDKPVDLQDEKLIDEDQVYWGDFYETKGYLYKVQDDLPQALMYYSKAITIISNNKSNPVCFSLAQIYSKLHNYKEEINQYLRIISNNPQKNEFQYHNNLGNAYFKLRDCKNATLAYQKGSELETSARILGNLGASLIAQHDYEAALKALDHALALERDHTESFFLSGLAYQGKKDIVNAMKYFQKAIKSDQAYSPAYLQMAQIKISMGKEKEAIQICQDCLSQSQNDLQVLEFLGDTHLKTRDVWAALAVFEQIQVIVQTLEKTTTYSKAIELKSNLQISRIFEQLSEPNKAINHLESCLKKNKDHPSYLHELGKLIMNYKKDIPKALELFKQASNDSPDNAIYLFSMADALHHLQKYELEIECLNQCLTLKPSFSERIYNNIALSYQSLNQLYKAVISFQNGIANCSRKSSQELHYNFGNLLYFQNKYSEAAEHYENCLEHNPHHKAAFKGLANTYLQLKDFQKAVNYFKKCLDLVNYEETDFYVSRINILLKKGYFPTQI